MYQLENELVAFERVDCANCGVPFMIYKPQLNKLRETKDTFYCPNGHAQSYRKSTLQIKIEEIKKELDTTKKRLDNEISWATQLQYENRELKKVLCPYCGKKLLGLPAHLKRKHKEETAHGNT